MKICAYVYSNQGGRAQNEDHIAYEIGKNRSFFVLADGLGGHKNGAAASVIAVNAVAEHLKKAVNITTDEMGKALAYANHFILEKQSEPDFASMKTTAVALCISDDKAFWGHVGDSRLYYFRDGALDTVTRDHSVSYKKYCGGEITYRDIYGDDDRSSLLRVLGNPDKFLPEVLEEPKELKSGDAFLLCSDGFWEYVYDEEMHIDLLKSSTPQEWGEFLLLRHVRRIGTNNDNLSVIAILVA